MSTATLESGRESAERMPNQVEWKHLVHDTGARLEFLKILRTMPGTEGMMPALSDTIYKIALEKNLPPKDLEEFSDMLSAIGMKLTGFESSSSPASASESHLTPESESTDTTRVDKVEETAALEIPAAAPGQGYAGRRATPNFYAAPNTTPVPAPEAESVVIPEPAPEAAPVETVVEKEEMSLDEIKSGIDHIKNDVVGLQRWLETLKSDKEADREYAEALKDLTALGSLDAVSIDRVRTAYQRLEAAANALSEEQPAVSPEPVPIVEAMVEEVIPAPTTEPETVSKMEPVTPKTSEQQPVVTELDVSGEVKEAVVEDAPTWNSVSVNKTPEAPSQLAPRGGVDMYREPVGPIAQAMPENVVSAGAADPYRNAIPASEQSIPAEIPAISKASVSEQAPVLSDNEPSLEVIPTNPEPSSRIDDDPAMLMDPEVTKGLEQLLSEWDIFKKKTGFMAKLGLSGGGADYETLASLPIDQILAGSLQGVEPEVITSITEYVDGWKAQLGLDITPGESFETYLRRAVVATLQHIKERGS